MKVPGDLVSLVNVSVSPDQHAEVLGTEDGAEGSHQPRLLGLETGCQAHEVRLPL